MSDIFHEAVKRFQQQGRYAPHARTRRHGYAFYARRSLELPEHETRFNAPLSLTITDRGEMRVTLFPISVHLCEAQFQEAERTIPFEREPPPNAPPTNDVTEQWYCTLNRAEWNTHKETLFGLAEAVTAAWDEAGRNAGPQAAQSADMD